MIAFAVLGVVILVANTPIEIKLLAGVIGLAGIAVAWRQISWLESLERLIISGDGLQVIHNAGDPQEVTIVGGVFVSPLVATFKCLPSNKLHVNGPLQNLLQKFWAISVVVFKDSVSEIDHHVLRVYLNTGNVLSPMVIE